VSDTTLEEAKRCPRCKEPGAEVSNYPTGDGRVRVFQCDNDRCPRVRDRWLVQVRADGTIPDRSKDKGGMDKEFPVMSDSWLATGQRLVEDAVGEDLRSQEDAY
jgi:hypothetical protein